MLRIAASSEGFREARQIIADASDDPGAYFAPRLRDWHNSCISACIAANFDRCEALDGMQAVIGSGRNIQRGAYNIPLNDQGSKSAISRVPSLRCGLLRRLRYWDLNRPVDGLTDFAVNNLSIAATLLPPGVVVGTIKTICNAWPTATRFHHKKSQNDGDGKCIFCGLPRSDRLTHYLACPILREGWRFAAGPRQFPNGRQATLAFFCLARTMTEEEVTVVCIINDAFLKTFNAVRTGASPERAGQIIKARLRFWSLKSNSRYGKILRDHLTKARGVHGGGAGDPL